MVRRLVPGGMASLMHVGKKRSKGISFLTWVVHDCAVCAQYDTVYVYDYGDGSSFCSAYGVFNQESANCSKNFFNSSCGTFSGNLLISISNINGRQADDYVLPAIATWLTNLGLGSLSVLVGNLTILVDHTPYSIPRPISPEFLQQLQTANSISVFECADCYNDYYEPPVAFSVLTALPGLSQVVQLTSPSSANLFSPSLQLVGTGFQNLLSFSSLACQQSWLSMLRNRALQTFDGLDAVQPSNGSVIDAFGSGPFNTAASVAALRSMAGCLIGLNPPGYVYIPTDCVPINSFEEICTYQGSSPCRWDCICPPSPSLSPISRQTDRCPCMPKDGKRLSSTCQR